MMKMSKREETSHLADYTMPAGSKDMLIEFQRRDMKESWGTKKSTKRKMRENVSEVVDG